MILRSIGGADNAAGTSKICGLAWVVDTRGRLLQARRIHADKGQVLRPLSVALSHLLAMLGREEPDAYTKVHLVGSCVCRKEGTED